MTMETHGSRAKGYDAKQARPKGHVCCEHPPEGTMWQQISIW